MIYSFIFFASLMTAFANDSDICKDIQSDLDRLKDELRELQKFKEHANQFDRRLEKEVKELRMLLNRPDTVRDRRQAHVPPLWTHCPNGSVQHQSSCYMVSHEVANWPDALVYCEAYGGNLAFIESASEQQFIASHIQKVNAVGTDPTHYYWVGGLDAVSENEWFWAKTIQPLTYKNWSPGEPDNSATHNSKRQDCLGLFSNGLWDDGWCEDKHNFICEIKLV